MVVVRRRQRWWHRKKPNSNQHSSLYMLLSSACDIHHARIWKWSYAQGTHKWCTLFHPLYLSGHPILFTVAEYYETSVFCIVHNIRIISTELISAIEICSTCFCPCIMKHVALSRKVRASWLRFIRSVCVCVCDPMYDLHRIVSSACCSWMISVLHTHTYIYTLFRTKLKYVSCVTIVRA